MNRIEANGLTFTIGIAGTGPRLLFLTGSGADLRRRKTPLNSSLAEDFTVLTYDQRGMGQSDKPDCDYTMRDYAEDAAAILDAVGWGSARVIGYSFGGMVAQELAIGWPEKVTRLALVATTAGGVGGASYPIHELDSLPERDRAIRSLEVADLSFTPAWRAAHPDEAEARISAKIKAQTAFSDSEMRKGRVRQLAARARHDASDRLGSIRVPTYVLGGSRDGQAPIGAQKALADLIPGSRFEEIDGGHGLVWADDRACGLIARFMSEPIS